MRTPPEELIPGALEKYTHDLTALARQGQFAPLQWREKEVERIFEVLARPLKNNPMLIGEDSTERFAIVAEVVRHISTGDAPEGFPIQQVMALDVELLTAGTPYRYKWEKRLKSVFAELKQSVGQTILVVDNFPRLMGAGPEKTCMWMHTILSPAFARREIQLIGTSTLDDYHKHVERDHGLQRRFQEVLVN